MDSSTKWVALTSFIVAVAFAAALTVNVPPYISGTPLSNGLIARLHFSKEYYAVEPVNATFEYYNPTSNPVTFTPANMLYVEAGYEGQFLKRQIHGISPVEAITLRPGETYARAGLSLYWCKMVLNLHSRLQSINGLYQGEVHEPAEGPT